MVEVENEPPHPPRFARCQCALRGDVHLNVERMMKGLWDAPSILDTPLLGKHEESIRITAGNEFLSHLRHLAIRMPTTWVCRVVSDAQLTTAWLASIALQGKEILDADAYKVSTTHLTIPDLVVPPDLVILRMGVKVARNAAASECLAEALNIREHENLPTWVWDEPHYPLDTGHLFWSDVVGRILRPWPHFSNLDLPGSVTKAQPSSGKKAGSTKRLKSRKTLRGGPQ